MTKTAHAQRRARCAEHAGAPLSNVNTRTLPARARARMPMLGDRVTEHQNLDTRGLSHSLMARSALGSKVVSICAYSSGEPVLAG
jgi:hypothetical protein